MAAWTFEDAFPGSPAFLEIQPLRIPAGWTIGWNQLLVTMDADKTGIGGSSIFFATNVGRRFNLDVEFRPEFDPEGAFHLTVLYAPWPRDARGRRLKDAPVAFGLDAEVVHRMETRSYPELVEALEYWIARCTVWTREGH